MSKSLTKPNGYKVLVKRVQAELDELEFFIKRRMTQGIWSIGRYVHQHLLAHEKSEESRFKFYERLAKDVGRDRTTLQRAVRFYLAYPNCAEWHNLTWEHYRNLITIKDEKERKDVEQKVIRGDWSSTKLRNYLSTKRKLASVKRDNKPVAQLAFTRGQLNVCPVRISKLTGQLSLDLGFRSRRAFLEGEPKGLKEGDCVLVDRKSVNWTWQKVDISKSELFTYQAKVSKVVDADTLVIALDMGVGMSSEDQRLRLRGIDCPELDTEEGQRAKRFVQARLNACDFVVVKTFKETVDLHDRYIVDVFYMPGESDPHKVAKEGTYLNQELLNEGLAIAYE